MGETRSEMAEAKTAHEKRKNKNETANEGSDMDEVEKMEKILSEEANKDVRNQYHELMTVIHQHTEEETNIDLLNIQMLVLQANEAFENVRRPREAAIDAHLLKACGNLARINIEASQSSLAVFRPREFAEKLVAFSILQGEQTAAEEDVSTMTRFGRKVSHLLKNVPGIEPFFSAMEWDCPVPQRRKKHEQKKDDQKAMMAPKKVAVSSGGEKEAEAVTWLYKILKQCFAAAGGKPLCFFSFMVDPHSFSRTIENLFHVSLLVREQYVEILEDREGLPVIQPTQNVGACGVEGTDKQCILSMDMQEWQELIKLINITTAMIPPMKKSSRKRKNGEIKK